MINYNTTGTADTLYWIEGSNTSLAERHVWLPIIQTELKIDIQKTLRELQEKFGMFDNLKFKDEEPKEVQEQFPLLALRRGRIIERVK